MIGNSAGHATAFLYVLKICGVTITVFDRPLRAALHHLIELGGGQRRDQVGDAPALVGDGGQEIHALDRSGSTGLTGRSGPATVG